MITPFDDYSIHQTHEPLCHPAQSDRNFYDRYWFNGADRGGKFFFEIGFGVYPNRFVMDGHFSVVVDGVQHSFHSSRRCPADRTKTVIGPLRLLVEEPMRKVRLCIDDNETGISCDLLFVACTVPTEEPKNMRYEDTRLTMYNSRFTQFGSWHGWFQAGGQRVEVKGAATAGTRDKSWGVRPVGEPEGGGLATTAAAGPRVYWIWSPINFGDICTQFGSFETSEGFPTQLSGCIVPTYGSVDDIPEGPEPKHKEMKTVQHRVTWVKGTRRVQSVEMEFCERDGSVHSIQLEAMADPFYMRGIGYGHPEWAHGVWQGEEKIGGETWQQDAVEPLEPSHIHAHIPMRAKMGEREGIGLVETVVFGSHEPSGFKELLDGAL